LDARIQSENNKHTDHNVDWAIAGKSARQSIFDCCAIASTMDRLFNIPSRAYPPNLYTVSMFRVILYAILGFLVAALFTPAIFQPFLTPAIWGVLSIVGAVVGAAIGLLLNHLLGIQAVWNAKGFSDYAHDRIPFVLLPRATREHFFDGLRGEQSSQLPEEPDNATAQRVDQ
jgi:hypothetical protein